MRYIKCIISVCNVSLVEVRVHLRWSISSMISEMFDAQSGPRCVGGLMGYFLSFSWMQSALLLRRRIALYLHIIISLYHCAQKHKECLED